MRREMDDAFREMVHISEEAGLYDEPQVMVCLDHMCFLPCRHESRCVSSGIRPCCNVSADPADIERVRLRQQEGPS